MRGKLFFVAMFLGIANVKGQSKFVDRSTDVLCVVPTLSGVCLAISNDDMKGAVQLGLSSATTLVVDRRQGQSRFSKYPYSIRLRRFHFPYEEIWMEMGHSSLRRVGIRGLGAHLC